mgnify:CR=1 FL=1
MPTRENPVVLVTPTPEQILEFCARDPIERVFLEDAARRGYARFAAVERDGRLDALCYLGANVVPSGDGCQAFADEAARRARLPGRGHCVTKSACLCGWELILKES